MQRPLDLGFRSAKPVISTIVIWNNICGFAGGWKVGALYIVSRGEGLADVIDGSDVIDGTTGSVGIDGGSAGIEVGVCIDGYIGITCPNDLLRERQWHYIFTV